MSTVPEVMALVNSVSSQNWKTPDATPIESPIICATSFLTKQVPLYLVKKRVFVYVSFSFLA